MFFVYYILVKWTKEKERKTQVDALSNREVPSIVFVQNQTKLNEFLAEAKENEAKQKQELRRRAEISAWFNLLVYEKIQEEFEMQNDVYTSFIESFYYEDNGEVLFSGEEFP